MSKQGKYEPAKQTPRSVKKKSKNKLLMSLITSILGMVLSTSMLLGTTMAWFTDTVEVRGNQIKTGSLEVKIENLTGVGTSTVLENGSNPVFEGSVIWKPDVTQARILKISNEGSIPARFTLSLLEDGNFADATKDNTIARSFHVYVRKVTEALNADAFAYYANLDHGKLQDNGWVWKGSLATVMEGTFLAESDKAAPLAKGQSATYAVAIWMDANALSEATANRSMGLNIRLNAYQDDIPDEEISNPTTYVTAGSAEDFNKALTGSDNKVAVTLADGSYTMPASGLQGKTLTIKGSKDVVIDASAIDQNNQFVTGASLNFEGVTLNFGNVNYMGFANTASLTYKNCDINGLQFLYGENVTFENCDLNSNGAEHCAWTYGANNVRFIGCDFTYGDRAVNCYSDQSVQATKASFTDCTFTKVAGAATTGAIETNSSLMTGLDLTITNCSVNEGKLWWVSSYDTLFGANTTVNGTSAKTESVTE